MILLPALNPQLLSKSKFSRFQLPMAFLASLALEHSEGTAVKEGA